MQWPSFDRLPLMDLSSSNLRSFSAWGRSEEMLNFSEPARSTTLSWIDFKSTCETTTSCYFVSGLTTSCSYLRWKIECDLELLILTEVELVDLFWVEYRLPWLLQPKSWSLLSYWWPQWQKVPQWLFPPFLTSEGQETSDLLSTSRKSFSCRFKRNLWWFCCFSFSSALRRSTPRSGVKFPFPNCRELSCKNHRLSCFRGSFR